MGFFRNYLPFRRRKQSYFIDSLRRRLRAPPQLVKKEIWIASQLQAYSAAAQRAAKYR